MLKLETLNLLQIILGEIILSVVLDLTNPIRNQVRKT